MIWKLSMTVHRISQQPATIEFMSGKTSCFRQCGPMIAELSSFPPMYSQMLHFRFVSGGKRFFLLRSSDYFFPFKRWHSRGLKQQAGQARECDLSEELPVILHCYTWRNCAAWNWSKLTQMHMWVSCSMCLHHLDAAGATCFPRPSAFLSHTASKISVPGFFFLLLVILPQSMNSSITPL